MKSRLLWILPAVLACQGQNAPTLGLFENQSDIGAVLTAGNAEFDPAKGSYRISAAGENMWAAADEFHYVWKRVAGDVALSAGIAFSTTGGNAHKKGMLIIRQSLDANSAYVDAALHGNGLTSIQTRSAAGANTFEIQSPVTAPKRLRIEKRGKDFFLSVAAEGEALHPSGGSVQLALQEPFYIGLGVCAHDKNAFESVVFSNVQIEKPVTTGLTLYSTLEVAPIPGDRRALYVTSGRIESPAWSPDGAAILFTVDGKPHRIPAGGGKPEPAEAAPAEPAATGAQLPAPDGRRTLTFSGDELRLTTTADGKTTTLARITGGKGTLSTAPWSPDSRRVAYVTYQMLPK